MRFDFHQRVRHLLVFAIDAIRVREQSLRHVALHHCGVVVIRDHVALWMQLVRVANHFKQTDRLRFAINDEIGVENLVAAMFRVRLRKHHQFDVGRIALEVEIRVEQIVHFVIRQGQAQINICLLQCSLTARQNSNGAQRLTRQVIE